MTLDATSDIDVSFDIGERRLTGTGSNSKHLLWINVRIHTSQPLHRNNVGLVSMTCHSSAQLEITASIIHTTDDGLSTVMNGEMDRNCMPHPDWSSVCNRLMSTDQDRLTHSSLFWRSPWCPPLGLGLSSMKQICCVDDDSYRWMQIMSSNLTYVAPWVFLRKSSIVNRSLALLTKHLPSLT